jgi:hypothetical protein
MRTPINLRSALAAIALLGACSQGTPTTSPGTPGVDVVNSPALLTSVDLVIPGTDLGAFANPIVADNSGGAFWNSSSDDGTNCSIGHFALGTMDATCADYGTGSNANQGGGYSLYWGDGAAHQGASSFMFKGNYAYKITFKGSYAGESSKIGWFTVTAGVYTFHQLWTDKNTQIGQTAIIHPAGNENWGLYIEHPEHPATSCRINTDCSNATGDIHGGAIPQQFALMSNADGTRFLVGMEDNAEEEAGIGDDDFNDFIVSVELLPVPMFVIGDVEAHAVGDAVNFQGAQWWKNNSMSGVVSNGVASFKGYAVTANNYCGGTWTSLPGNSSNPPATISEYVAVMVTSKVLKSGSNISGDIRQILIVHQDGGYAGNPGHPGNGPVVAIICPQVPN